MFAMTGGYSGLPLEDTDGTWAEPPPRGPLSHTPLLGPTGRAFSKLT